LYIHLVNTPAFIGFDCRERGFEKNPSHFLVIYKNIYYLCAEVKGLYVLETNY